MSTAILEAEVHLGAPEGRGVPAADGVVARLWDEAVRSVTAQRVPPARAPERHQVPMPMLVQNPYD